MVVCIMELCTEVAVQITAADINVLYSTIDQITAYHVEMLCILYMQYHRYTDLQSPLQKHAPRDSTSIVPHIRNNTNRYRFLQHRHCNKLVVPGCT